MTDNEIEKINGNKPSKKQYFFIYEGEKTEPEYFNFIKLNKYGLGMDVVICNNKIEKNKIIDKNNTDILSLVSIAESYVASSRGHNYTPWEICTRLLEQYAQSAKNEYEKKIKSLRDKKAISTTKNTYNNKINIARKTRDEIVKLFDNEYESFLDENNVIKSSNIDKAIDICKKEIEKRITNYSFQIPRFDTDFSKREIKYGDIICIVHDRDFSQKHFPHSKYEKSLKKINEINKTSDVKYTLAITYPKFEFWLLMHKLDKTELNNLDRDYLTNYEGTKVYPHNEGTGPSEYVTFLIKKHMDKNYQKELTEKMKKIMHDGFDNAIEMANSNIYTNNIELLMKEPGTNIGIIFNEMKNNVS